MMQAIKAVLIDLSGYPDTIHIENQALPGAIEALRKLRSRSDMKVTFLSNTTKTSRSRLVKQLQELGFDIQIDDVITSLTAAQMFVNKESLKPMLFLENDAKEGFVEYEASEANAVVIGLSPSSFNYIKMNDAFRVLKRGGKLIAVHKGTKLINTTLDFNKGRYYERADGLALGPGAFVSALEFAAETSSTIIGKPSKNFFQIALDHLEVTPSECIMIGDDVRDDIEGAQRLGIAGILVKTGKYRPGDENKIEECPKMIANDFAEAIIDFNTASIILTHFMAHTPTPVKTPLPFRDLVELFGFVDKDQQLKKSKLDQLLKTWTQHCFNHSTRNGTLDWIRLLVPEDDVQRSYHLREQTLAERLCNVFGWSHGTEKYNQLKQWKHKLTELDQTAADFSRRFAWIRGPECLIRSVITVDEVNDLLDQLALHSKYSDIDGLGAGKVNPERTQQSQVEILRRLFMYLTQEESLWLIRIILKDMKWNHTRQRLFACIHPFLNRIYDHRNGLMAASEQLDAIFRDSSQEMVDLGAGREIGSTAYRRLAEKYIQPSIGCNIAIMQCAKAKSCYDVVRNFPGLTVAVDTKYDGERLQVHIKLDQEQKITIFNKSRRNATWERRNSHQLILAGIGRAEPDFYEKLSYHPKQRDAQQNVNECILEGEILTYNEQTKQVELFGPIRMLEGSGFGNDPLVRTGVRHYMVIWFDLLWLNGTNMLTLPFFERRRKLIDIIETIPNRICIAESKQFDFRKDEAPELFREYYAELLARPEEGVIVKPLDSIYEPGQEGHWLKLKRDYIDGLGDTADFAIIGGCLSDKTATKFTRAENRFGGCMTTFVVACMTNKDMVLERPNTRPNFRIVFCVEAGFSENFVRIFNQQTESTRLSNKNYPQSWKRLMNELPYDVMCAKSGFSLKKIDYFFPTPYVFELLGGSFVRDYGDDFFSLRFPRFKRLRTDVTWRDTISFPELQSMAVEALSPSCDEKKADLVIKLEEIDSGYHSKRPRRSAPTRIEYASSLKSVIETPHVLTAAVESKAPNEETNLTKTTVPVSKPLTNAQDDFFSFALFRDDPPADTNTVSTSSEPPVDANAKEFMETLLNGFFYFHQPHSWHGNQWQKIMNGLGMDRGGSRHMHVLNSLPALFAAAAWQPTPPSNITTENQEQQSWCLILVGDNAEEFVKHLDNRLNSYLFRPTPVRVVKCDVLKHLHEKTLSTELFDTLVLKTLE